MVKLNDILGKYVFFYLTDIVILTNIYLFLLQLDADEDNVVDDE